MEMNMLEMDFLFGIGFDLNVTPSTFHTYSSHFIAQIHAQGPHPFLQQQLGIVNNHDLQCCLDENECIDHHHHKLAVVYQAN